MAGKHRRKNQKRYQIFTTLFALTIGIITLHSCQNDRENNEEQGSEPTSGESNAIVETLEEESHSSGSEEEVSSLTEEERLKSKIVETPDVQLADWELILVNRENQLAENPAFTPYYTENGIMIDERIAEAYESMIADGRALGLEFILVSGYRSIERQQSNYNSVYQTYINQGLSEEEAIKKTEEYIALPNASEHSTGLAVDITEPDLYYQEESGLVEEFEDTAEGKWLRENAANYGFILRYPRGKEAITFIEYESWHFRYVGIENALYMDEHDLTLEEYIELLQKNEEIQHQINNLTE